MREHKIALQNQPVDVSGEFARQGSHFFIGTKLSNFVPDTASGEILWKGRALKQRVSCHQLTLEFDDYRVWRDTPPEEYEDDQSLPFLLSFVSPRTVCSTACGSRAKGAAVELEDDPPRGTVEWEVSTLGSESVQDA